MKTIFTITSIGITVLLPITVEAANKIPILEKNSSTFNNQFWQQTQTISTNFNYSLTLCEMLRNEKKYEAALEACNQAVQIKKRDAKLWANRSQILLNLDKNEEAVTSALAALNIKPNYSLALTYQCQALSQLKRYTEAIATCDRALQINSNWDNISPAQTWYNRGLALNGLKNYPQALAAYEQSLQIKPNNSAALTQKCAVLSQLNQQETAIKTCDRALEINSEWHNISPAQAWYNKALAATLWGQYQQARGNCPQLTANSRPYLNTLVAQCIRKKRLARLETALNSYQQVIALNPKDINAWTNRGALLNQLGKYQQAQTAQEWAIKINSNHSQALANACTTFNKLGNYQEALNLCDRALQADNNWDENGVAYVWVQRGQALSGLSQHAEALDSIERAIALKSEYAEAWNAKSVILWQVQKYQEALIASDRAVEINPNFSQAWFNRGRILSSLQQYKEALTAYDKALATEASLLEPKMLAEVWANRSAVLLKLTQYQDALNSANSALAINPSLTAGLLNKGIALTLLKEYQSAFKNYQQAINTYPKNPDFWFAQAGILIRLKRYEQALTATEEVLKIDSNYPQAQQQQQALTAKVNLTPTP